MRNSLLPLLVLLLLLAISCKKNNSDHPHPPIKDSVSASDFARNFGNEVSRDFIVQLVDVSNNPVPGATVTIGTSTTQTNPGGIAIIKNAGVYERFAYIRAAKTGFMEGSRALMPSTSTNVIKIMMLPSHITATVNSGVTSDVSLSNGTRITFDGNFKTLTGTTYTGAVSVIVNSLEASDNNLFAKMPGMLYAQNAADDAKLLETYGMMNVELLGSAGQKLQISNKAQIEMNITAAQLSVAPATIPLWHFDETLGYWKEAGVANKVGNKYIGEVAHFSWWNFDIPLATSPVQLQIKVVDLANNPLANVKTVLFRTGGAYASYADYTLFNGTVTGTVPQNEVLTLKLYDICGNVIYTQNIGPFTANSNVLPDIVLNLPATQVATINGSLKKCNNTNVTNGYVSINYGQQTFLTLINNGGFSFQTIVCSTDPVTVFGEDADNHQNTGTLNYSITSPTTNIGNIPACNTSAESITYAIDGGVTKIIAANITASATGNSFSITGNTPGHMDAIDIQGNSITPGTYSTLSGFQIYGNGLSTNINPVFNTFNITYNLVNVGAVGQYIDVSFSGTYNEIVMTGMNMGYNLSHSISGTAHVIRDN
ncbi:Uncharacterised protein family UPF0560 [Chitinophaga ginsengisegetis]|uniref:Uncharacterized protein family UPF0560 n=1 Tax=Chitinophaga ginsengisegetis TaxID=393003 RepID=A0A1T5PCG8_9BACT|nr:hypothetical protein [Chitinophaga ginsengisegetis]SKD10277.1 Uncharacterised protein family UPF0560 [Chitinophaga ginsengisegetis]